MEKERGVITIPIPTPIPIPISISISITISMSNTFIIAGSHCAQRSEISRTDCEVADKSRCTFVDYAGNGDGDGDGDGYGDGGGDGDGHDDAGTIEDKGSRQQCR